MKLIKLLTGRLLLAATTVAFAGEKPDSKPSAPVVLATNATSQVIAYYFHVTVRCETCLKIEKQAREIVERRFQAELATNRLVFRPINYELKENSHFAQDYKLPCPSLVLVRQENGKDVKWKLLGKTWTLVNDSAAFDQYVEKEVDTYLNELSNRAGAAGTTNSPSKEPISESTPGTIVDSLADMDAHFGDMNAVFLLIPGTNGLSSVNWVPMNRAKRNLEAEWDVTLGLFGLKPGSPDYNRIAARETVGGQPAMMVILRNGTISVLSRELTETNLFKEFVYAVCIGGCCPLGDD